MPSKIFISYRRDDTAYQAGWLYDTLKSKFPEEHLFKDIDTIPLGADFKKFIEDQVNECLIVLVVIGKKFTKITDEKGIARIHRKDDFVNIELAKALRAKKRIIPILVENAEMPSVEELPANLKTLPLLNGIELRHESWNRDSQKLIENLSKILEGIEKQEEEHKAKEEAEFKRKQEKERKAKEEAELKRKQDQERKAYKEAELKRKKKEELKAKKEAELKRKQEEERKVKEEAIKIFIAYSRQDTSYLDELRTHFSPLERLDKVTIWYDGKIEPGAAWDKEIKKHLHEADIVLLLISASAIASDYFYEQEMIDALERHKQGKTRVVPFILRPCAWKATPLADLQAIPKDAKPATTWTDRDEAYNDAVIRLWEMVIKIEKKNIIQPEIERKEKVEEEQIAKDVAELKPKQEEDQKVMEKAELKIKKGVHELMIIIAKRFESSDEDHIKYDELKNSMKVSKTYLDIIIDEAVSIGYIGRNNQNEIWLLAPGKKYAINKNIV